MQPSTIAKKRGEGKFFFSAVKLPKCSTYSFGRFWGRGGRKSEKQNDPFIKCVQKGKQQKIRPDFSCFYCFCFVFFNQWVNPSESLHQLTISAKKRKKKKNSGTRKFFNRTGGRKLKKKISSPCWKHWIILISSLVSRVRAVVRALASHRCVPSSIPGPSVICGLSLLLVFFLVPRDFSPGTPAGFPLSQISNISKFQFHLDYCQALYHEPLPREIAHWALPVFDIKLAFTFFFLLVSIITCID